MRHGVLWCDVCCSVGRSVICWSRLGISCHDISSAWSTLTTAVPESSSVLISASVSLGVPSAADTFSPTAALSSAGNLRHCYLPSCYTISIVCSSTCVKLWCQSDLDFGLRDSFLYLRSTERDVHYEFLQGLSYDCEQPGTNLTLTNLSIILPLKSY